MWHVRCLVGRQMLDGIYHNASSMTGLESWNNAIAQNLAQSSAPGYKKAMLTFEGKPNGALGFESIMDGEVVFKESIAATARGSINFTEGQISVTDNHLDFAIEGPGFFELQKPETGEFIYTRDGQFKVNEDGELVSKQGYLVMSDTRKEIRLRPNGGQLSAGTDGVIYQQGEEGNERLDKIGIKDVEDKKALVRQHGGFILAQDRDVEAMEVEVDDRNVRHGALELSNVSATHEMINMITASRAFNVNQKVIQNHDTLLGEAIRKLGGP